MKRSRDPAVKNRFGKVFVVYFIGDMGQTAENKVRDEKRGNKGGQRKNQKLRVFKFFQRPDKEGVGFGYGEKCS